MSGDEFFARRPNKLRLLIDVVSGPLAKSPVSFHQGDAHIFTQKSLLHPGEFLITCAKGLLQQYRHQPEVPVRAANVGSLT
jgi:hypothetical protein